MSIDRMFEIPPYSLNQSQKEDLLLEELKELTKRHKGLCPEYGSILNSLGADIDSISCISEIPFLPVRLFKEYNLKSVETISKTMTSSGTTGQQVSKIFLDKRTSENQTKVLSKIVASFIGGKRLPLLILDSDGINKDRNLFSARGAGIRGFSIFGRDILYAFDQNMKIKYDEVQAFIEKHKNQKILLFGFTFIIWQHFYQELMLKNRKLDLSNGILIHGGGWKKLAEQAVDTQSFRAALKSVSGIEDVHDYYGMVEQTGSIYMECECGYLHASIYSDIIIRRPSDFSEAEIGEIGIVQTLSVIPESYPGHSLLTEDVGTIAGIDSCECGRLGRYFRVNGRLLNAEIRGCSDTYEAK